MAKKTATTTDNNNGFGYASAADRAASIARSNAYATASGGTASPTGGSVSSSGIKTSKIEDNPLVFDTPAYHNLVGPTTAVMTPEQTKNVESTITGFKNYVGTNSDAVYSSDGIAKLIADYQKQLKDTNTKLTNTQNTYYTEKKKTADLLAEAKKNATASTGTSAPTPEGGTSTDQTNGDTVTVSPEYQSAFEENKKFNNVMLRDINNNYDNVLKGLSQYRQTLDDQYGSMMDMIASSFDQRRQTQNQNAAALEGGLDVAGLRSGRTRYATEMQDMLISEAERANLAELAKIDTEERKAVLEANDAFNKDNFELFLKQSETIEKKQQAKKDIIKDLYDNALQYDNQLLESRRENRLAKADELDRTVTISKTFAPTILNKMTGDAAKDQAMIEEYASRLGISPDFMNAQVQAAIYEARQKEREAALKSGGKADFITAEEAQKKGLPFSLIGKTEDELVYDMYSATPPDWYVDIYATETDDPGLLMSSINPQDPTIAKAWKNFRASKLDELSSTGYIGEGMGGVLNLSGSQQQTSTSTTTDSGNSLTI